MSDKNKQSIGVKKASDRLKEKLKEGEKVSLKSYTLSNSEDVNRHKIEKSSPKNPHEVKPHRKGFRMSSVALSKLQKVYVARYSEDPSITHSTLICEAVDLLFAKQSRKKTENNLLSEQVDFFSQ